MSIASSVAARQAAKLKGPRCTVWRIRQQLSEADRAELDRMLADEALYDATDIAGALRDEGYPIADSTLQRHRRGGCACP